MKKNKVLLGSALALLIAPTVLSNLSPQDVSAAETSTESGLIGTVRRGSGILVNNQGQTITSTYLPNFSSWKLGPSTQINGITYYQVATNEWIAADSIDISNSSHQVTNLSSDTSNQIDVNATKVGTTKWASAVVNSQGQAITGVTLPAGTNWKLGASINVNGNVYLQVATNEWVAANDLNIQVTEPNQSYTTNNATTNAASTTTQQQQPVVGTVVNGPADLYDTSMDSFSDRQLPEGTNWKIGQMVQNKYGHTFYQVSTNEWAQSSNMHLNQNDAGNNVSSEPEFATSVTQ
ncbi:SLAP domain-containing protein [Companilactobacillus paralimentarius]|uniref:SLAP domain-containing protein n=1 Tax=Companilactobacillus paralimentarius TaxID=83526 RepID=UPI0028534EA0|nr:SLAP domain-containing protein [Companilactobacillus paralimentarius]MDR4932392.1 SLAP domain-containing protein [Companilactobacillus paralimentarius]